MTVLPERVYYADADVERAQSRLRAAARVAGWLAEYEVRGVAWIATITSG